LVHDRSFDASHGCGRSILAGLVAVTGPCALVDGWAACVIGVIGAGAYNFGSWLLLRLRIDDPLDASPLHFCCGLWGVVSVGLFSKPEYLEVSGILYTRVRAVVFEKHALWRFAVVMRTLPTFPLPSCPSHKLSQQHSAHLSTRFVTPAQPSLTN